MRGSQPAGPCVSSTWSRGGPGDDMLKRECGAAVAQNDDQLAGEAGKLGPWEFGRSYGRTTEK